MGWTFSNDPSFRRADLIKQLKSPGQWHPCKLLKSRAIGNNFWALVEGSSGVRFVCLVLMKGGGKDSGWGHKDIDESMGPLEVNCPISYLDGLPEPINSPSKEWRERVRAYHAKAMAQSKLAEGDVVEYAGRRFQLASRMSRGYWRVYEGSAVYRLSPRQIRHSIVIPKEEL